MTCKEKLVMESPGSVGYTGAPYGCPSDHGYLPTPDYCEWPFRHAYKCVNCWNREILENNEINKENDEMKKVIGCNTETAAYEEMEGEWTRTNVEATTTEEKEPTVAEIQEMMKNLDRDYTEAMRELKNCLKEAIAREKMREAADNLKMVLDTYISAGFTREEVMSMILSKIKEN